MKRVLSWILAICLLFALVPAGTLAAETVVESGSCGENLQWAFYDSGLLQITGSGKMDYYNNTPEVPWFDYLAQITAVSFPEGLESLSHFTFYGCTGLTEVTFPESLKSLGNAAFHGCTGLTEVVIPDSVTQLGAYTFSECANLERVELSDSLTGIHSEVFYFCKKLKSIDIPEGVTWIGEDAFCSCEAMTSVKLPQTLTSIGAGAFSGCWAIEDLDIPAGVETIGNDAFYGCRSYDELRIPEGACVGLRAFVGGQFTKLTLPDNVHCLGNFAFEDCDSITAVTIPSSLTFINYGLFYDCENLRDVIIPETIESIYTHAFSGCESLKYLAIPGSVRFIGDYSLGYLEDAEIRFLGDAPELEDWVFNRSVVTCYYPADNGTWTEQVRQQYGGTVTWIPVSGCQEIHTWTTTIFAPTCTEGGYTLRVCSLCGAREEQDPTAALGHDWTEWGINQEPKCLIEGRRSRSCQRCGEWGTEKIPALGHDMGEWSTEREPTCTAPGSELRPCNRCTYSERRTVASLGHRMGEWVVIREPDCWSTGTRERKCVVCGHFEIEQIPRGNHDFVTEIIEPTCSEGGYTKGTCTICGTVEKFDFTDPIEHSYGAWSVWQEPDCLSPGRRGCKCSVCGYPVGEEIPALGHDYVWGCCTRCGDTVDSGFADVAPGSFYFDSVGWAVERGITYGTGDGFAPYDACTRAQAVTFLWRAKGCPEPETKGNPFPDVSEKDYYYKAVLWAAEKGITYGVGDGRFAPHEICNRAQIVSFLWRAEGAPAQTGESRFRDVTAGDWFSQGVLWAVRSGVTSGVADDRFGPYDTCDRAQMVTFLYRASE